MRLPLSIDLSGKVAVVTGGGGILCSSFAQAIAACGASVAVLDLKLNAAQEVANKIMQNGGNAIAVEADCLQRESLEKALGEIRTRFGEIDILINGAGGNHPKGTTEDEQYSPEAEGMRTFYDLDAEDIKFVLDLNFMGTLLPTQVFSRGMASRKGAVIVNISSMNALRPLTKIPAYSGAKAAVSNLTQWMAVYFAKAGIRVNAIAPGFFITNQNKALLFDEDGNPTPRTDKILRNTPMGRFGEPEELLGTLLWLLSEKASGFVTGIVIPVDGGFSAYSGV